MEIEYLELRDAETLGEYTPDRGAVLAAAVHLGGTRLIDNVAPHSPTRPGPPRARPHPREGHAMSTRPSGPAPATPGPGKVTLPDLREMKRRGQPHRDGDGVRLPLRRRRQRRPASTWCWSATPPP